jgi:hypothetical protein
VFPIQKCGFLFKIKENKHLRRGAASFVAQASEPINADIGQKDHLWMKTG